MNCKTTLLLRLSSATVVVHLVEAATLNSVAFAGVGHSNADS